MIVINFIYDMNIREFQYIVEIAKQRNFTKASKAVYVSQSTLSMQVKKMEEYLGVKIFERDNANVMVTKIGEKIIAKAKDILAEVDEIKEMAKNAQDELGGELRIGAFPTLAPYYFPKIASKISAKFPKLKLFLVEEKTEKLIEMLDNGEIDCAFLAEPIFENDFLKMKIFEEDFVLAAATQNKLAKKRKIARKDLSNLSLMLLEDGHCLRSQALEVCELTGAKEDDNYRASSLETLRQMVRLNAGVTLMPEIAAVKDRKVAYVKISDAPKRKIALFWRKNYYRQKFMKNLVEIL